MLIGTRIIKVGKKPKKTKTKPESWDTFIYTKVGRKPSGIEGGIPEVPVMS